MQELLHSLGQDHITDLPNFSKTHHVYQQIEGMDLAESMRQYEASKKALETGGVADIASISPLSTVVNFEDVEGGKTAEYDTAFDTGIRAIQESSVGCVIMSGGQGTRLNYDGPKGMYDMGLPSRRTIFKLHMDRIWAIRERARSTGESSCTIPVYIMTSDLNDAIIKECFYNNDYFGYDKEDVIFFEQGLEPCISLEGKLILESETSLAMAPDGNGGLYNALRKSGAFSDMERRGVKHLHVYGIDNVLTRSADPAFVGCCIAQDSDVGNKVVWRASASEKVGVAAEREGRMVILEYSEIPQELADAIERSSGKLIYGAGNICNHYIRVSFLKDVIFTNLTKMYHLAPKKIPYWDIEKRVQVVPPTNNGYKLEMFIFDPFPLASKYTVLEVQRKDEFAPVKNAPGSATDSPDTAREMLTAQSTAWLEKAGATVVRAGPDDHVEISAKKSLAGENLEDFAGKSVTAPVFIE